MSANPPQVGAEGLFLLFQAHPDLLPSAPDEIPTLDYRDRLKLAVGCIRCGQPSSIAMVIVHKRCGRKWLDLCADDGAWVRAALGRQRERKESGE